VVVNIVIITAIGTAKNIQTNHMISHQIIILIKIVSGLTHKVLFITRGISTLFSSHCIEKMTTTIINAGYIQLCNNTIKTVGIQPSIGQI
jgi:hypothetical protein